MAANIKNGRLSMDGTTMDYIRFGGGEKHLVMLPGLGDGLRAVRGMALSVHFIVLPIIPIIQIVFLPPAPPYATLCGRVI